MIFHARHTGAPVELNIVSGLQHFQGAFIPVWERKCSGKVVRMDSHEVSNNIQALLKSEIPRVKLGAFSFLILSQTRQHKVMRTH